MASLLEFDAGVRLNASATIITDPEADLAKQRAKILKSKVLYPGKVFRLQRDTVIEPGGVRAERDIIVHPGSVVVLPIFEDGRVLLIRQYRHSVGEFLWELVAGRKEPNETPRGRRAARTARGNRIHGETAPQTGARGSHARIRERVDVDLCSGRTDEGRGAAGRRRKDHAAHFYVETSGLDDRARHAA